jgi:hypothetical protein
MSKSLYSEFPTNAHAYAYGQWKVRLLIEACLKAIEAEAKQ